jgi:hypothetical protein
MCRYCRQFDPFSPQARWGDDGARQVLTGYAARSVNKAGMMVGQAKNPGLAKCFENSAAAYMLTRPERDEILVAVFETESQYFVAEVM